MKITTFILANNEERLMSFVMRHYTQFSDVILLESNSTDRTKEIAHKMGAEIWSYDWPDEINDQIFTDVKNTCWKDSKADWVIIADADEFVYHPDITKVLSKTRYTIIRPRFFDMYSERFPINGGQIYDEVQFGKEQFTPSPKMNIFRPQALSAMNYAPGCHDASPEGIVSIDLETEIKTLHMRYLSKEFVIEKNQRHSKRMSAINREKGWGWHVDKHRDVIEAEFDEAMKNLIKVI